MKKVLVLTPDIMGEGGVANYYRILNLQEHDHVDYFYVNSAKKQNIVFKGLGLVFKYIQFLFIVGKYDLCHLNISLDFKSYYRDLGYVALIRLFGKKFMCFFHGWEYPYEDKICNSKWRSSLFKNTIGKMDGCFLSGTIFKKSLERMGTNSACKYWVETMMADNRYLDKIDYDSKWQDKEQVNLLFISRVVKSKGIYIIAEAQKQLVAKFPNKKVNLIFAGDGPDFKEFKSFVEAEKIPNVEFTGYVRDEIKHEALNRGDIFFFPTYFPEGVPSVNLEAMLYGMPVISRINAGIPDVVDHGDEGNGYLSEALEAGPYVKFISKLIEQPELRIAMGKRNKKKALGRFVKERIEERVLNVYLELLD